MIKGFWKKLSERKGKPIMAIAPMANVTDAAFRIMLAKYGKPDVMWTEFVSTDGLMSKGQKNLLIDLKFDKSERPIVAQVFGSKPENFYKTALLLQELNFDGIDINLGCPDRNVEKQGAGAALMKNPKLAQEIIRETMRGAGKLPVSIKTRIGYSKNELATWLPALLEESPAAITIHARTRQEMSDVPARWEHVKEAVEIRDKAKSETLILGNGDVTSYEDGLKKIKDSGADGAMIGRGLFGNPWFFSRLNDPHNCHSGRSEESLAHLTIGQPDRDPSCVVRMTIGVTQKLEALVEHTHLFEKLLTEYKSLDIMKKHYKAYVSGFNGAKELRIKLMKTKNATEVEKIVMEFLN